ncbi:sugar kinase [Kiritimatiella glycovorans]|uniref:2-dehydro-3-deoxygluconokinase n=1 Tax=Kiritimatiella glycovorans TaxID=1307763 RepID=A0A0G3EHL8_9BACT|nr:sugar kinase [Kiritimatiella glycovorans]AKJ64917.1 2-dehydro-3-deoxygluconokinase [Kiritimatiella glycovorans]
MKPVVGFGEIMGRLAPEGFYRFSQSCPGRLDLTFAGAEANVAASIAMLGGSSAYVTALPDHAIADACVRSLKALDVETRHIVRTDSGRLGLYFVETGANQRPSNVIYDREHSAVSRTPADAYDWDAIFADAGWLHISGITPALSRCAAEASLAAVRGAKEAGLTVSCDLNFRKKLWKWDETLSPRELAGRTMRDILPFVDVVIGNEGDAEDVLGIRAGDSDVESGELAIDKYPEVAGQIAGQFPNVRKVAITLRESISASHNNWGAMLYDTESEQAVFAPMRDGEYRPYEIRNIVDRVGGGDSFAAGLIFALHSGEYTEHADAIAFAVAASCLAHSIKGDWNHSRRAEVEALMRGSGSGRVVR